MRYFKLIFPQKREKPTEAGRQAGGRECAGRCVVGGSWWPQEAAQVPAGAGCSAKCFLPCLSFCDT